MLANKFTTIAHSEGLRQTLVTVVGNTLATGLSALSLILISRILGPEKFGFFSVGFALVMILNRMSDGGLNGAILKFVPAASHEDRNHIFSFAFKTKLAFSLVLAILGCAFSPLIAEALHFPSYTIIVVAFLSNIVIVWYEQLLAMYQALHLFGKAVVWNAIQSTSKLLGVGVAVALGWVSPLGLFAWYMFVPLVAVGAAVLSLPKWVRFLPRTGEVQKKLIANMARHSAVGLIAAGLIENVDVLVVQRYLNTYESGLLGGVSRIAMMILLVAYSLGNVLYPRVARYADRENLEKYLKKAWLIAGLSVLGFLFFLPLARLSLVLTIGPQYSAGLPVLILLAASSFITLATIPFLALFYTLKAEWYFSASGLAQLAIILGGNLVFVPSHGLMAAAWTRLAARLFLMVFTIALALYYYRKEYGEAHSQATH